MKNPECIKTARIKWRNNNPKRAWSAYVMHKARARAVKNSIPFDITLDYLESICPDHCPVFGTEFKYIGGKIAKPESASLDRLSPRLGYVVGNVVVISLKANAIKSAYGSKEVQIVANWLRELGY